MPFIPTSLDAACCVASLVSGVLTASGLPECRPALAPAVSPETGAEAMPAAYAIPVSHSFERAARKVMRHEVDVALLLICEVPEGDSPEERAAEWLGVLQTAAEAVLESGTTPNAGVKFVSAEAAELADAELLALSGIFRAQINVRCLLLSGPAQS